MDEADVRSGKVKIIAPVEFMEHAISENIYAGNAMNRRLFYQYGVLLPASPFGTRRPGDREERLGWHYRADTAKRYYR